MARMARIGQLFVELSLKANNFNAGIKQAQKDAKELEKSIKPLKDLLNDLGKPLAAAGAAITGTLVALTKVAANYGDQLDEAAEKTGLTVQQLARLKYAGEQLDTSFEGVSTGLKFLSKNLFEAATGSKEQIRLFKALGIQTKNASGDIRPVNDVLMEMSGIFQNLPNGAGKTALAMQIFGKAGQDLIPFLNAGPEGLRQLGDEAERLGIVIDGSTAKLGDEFNKALDRSKTAALGFAIAIGNILLPSLTSLINKGNEAVVWASNLTREFPILTKAAGGLGIVLTGAGGVLLGLTALGTIAPKVATGLALIGSAIAPFAVLKGIKTYADLAAGISLIGRASLIAKLGLVGFAAGIGVAIGQLINMGLAMSGLQPHFDKFLASMANQASRSFFGKELFNTSDAMERSAASTKRAAESLAARGVIVERGTMTEQQYAEALAKAAREHFGLKDKVVTVSNATTDYDKVLRDLLASMENTAGATDRVRRATEDALDPIRELSQSFIATIRPADELNTKLTVLISKFDARDIVRAYGDDIIAAAAQQREFGAAVTGTIAELEKQALAMRKAQDIIKANQEGILDTLQPMAIPANLNNGAKGVSEAALKAAEDINRERRSLENLGKTLAELKTLHASDAEIIEKFGNEIKRAGEISRQTGRPLDENTARLLKQVQAAERAQKAAEAWSRAWSTAVGNIASQFSENVVDTLTSKLFPNRQAAASHRESLEKQITSIVQAQEKERLQAVIDKTVRGTRARKAAEMEMAAFERRLQQEAIAERDQQLVKLQNELAFQESAFKKFASGVKDIFADLGKSILKIFITDVFEKIAKEATSLLTDAIGGFGKALKGIFTSGTIGSLPGLPPVPRLPIETPPIAPPGLPPIGNTAGSIAGTAGSMASSLAGGLVSGGLAAVGSIVGSLMQKGNLKRTEENSRETRDWLELQTTAWNPLFHEQTSWLKWIAEQTTILGQHLLPAIEVWGSNIVNAIQGTSGSAVTTSRGVVTASTVQNNAPVNVHISAPFNFAPQFNLEGTDITPLTVRDKIAPELLLDYELGVRGHGEKLAQIVRDRLNGLTGTAVPVGI